LVLEDEKFPHKRAKFTFGASKGLRIKGRTNEGKEFLPCRGEGTKGLPLCEYFQGDGGKGEGCCKNPEREANLVGGGS